jgi:kynureninase
VGLSLFFIADTIGDPDEPCTYLLGNSLGLKPKKADKSVLLTHK